MKPIGPDLEDEISAKIGELEEKFGGILAKADTYYQEFRFYPEKRQVMKALGRMLWRIIRQFRFHDTRLWLRLGLDDPSSTGLILGAAGMLNHMIPSKELSLLLQPEFGQSLIEGGGTLHLRIRIQAFIPQRKYTRSLTTSVIFSTFRMYISSIKSTNRNFILSTCY